jgi:hypothetical protein
MAILDAPGRNAPWPGSNRGDAEAVLQQFRFLIRTNRASPPTIAVNCNDPEGQTRGARRRRYGRHYCSKQDPPGGAGTNRHSMQTRTAVSDSGIRTVARRGGNRRRSNFPREGGAPGSAVSRSSRLDCVRLSSRFDHYDGRAECDVMWSALNLLPTALAEAGFAPR